MPLGTMEPPGPTYKIGGSPTPHPLFLEPVKADGKVVASPKGGSEAAPKDPKSSKEADVPKGSSEAAPKDPNSSKEVDPAEPVADFDKGEMPMVKVSSQEHGRVKVKVDLQTVGATQKKRNPICQILCAPDGPNKQYQVAQITPKEPITMMEAYETCKKGAQMYANGGKDKDDIKRFLADEIKKIYKEKMNKHEDIS